MTANFEDKIIPLDFIEEHQGKVLKMSKRCYKWIFQHLDHNHELSLQFSLLTRKFVVHFDKQAVFKGTRSIFKPFRYESSLHDLNFLIVENMFTLELFINKQPFRKDTVIKVVDSARTDHVREREKMLTISKEKGNGSSETKDDFGPHNVPIRHFNTERYEDDDLRLHKDTHSLRDVSYPDDTLSPTNMANGVRNSAPRPFVPYSAQKAPNNNFFFNGNEKELAEKNAQNERPFTLPRSSKADNPLQKRPTFPASPTYQTDLVDPKAFEKKNTNTDTQTNIETTTWFAFDQQPTPPPINRVTFAQKTFTFSVMHPYEVKKEEYLDTTVSSGIVLPVDLLQKIYRI